MKTINPWLKLKQEDPFVLQEDAEIISQYNKKYKGKSFEIKLDVMPVPFVGDVFKSEIVILMLNPGYADNTKENENDQYKEKLISVFKHECKHYPFFCLDPTIMIGKKYWESKLKSLIKFYGNYDKISHKVSNIQYHPYSSKEFKPIELPSQEYNFYLIKKAIERKAIIVIARGKKYWYEAVPELEKYNRSVLLNNVRNPTLSQKNAPKLFELLF